MATNGVEGDPVAAAARAADAYLYDEFGEDQEEGADGSQSSGRSRRGGRGGGGKRWRGGPPPPPPELRGNMQSIQGKPFRLWLQRVERWRFLAKEYYPEREQATRLLECIFDDPAEELQVITDTEGNGYWTVPDGVDRIITVLSKECDEDRMIYRARVLGECEHVKRRQGEDLQEYVDTHHPLWTRARLRSLLLADKAGSAAAGSKTRRVRSL